MISEKSDRQINIVDCLNIFAGKPLRSDDELSITFENFSKFDAIIQRRIKKPVKHLDTAFNENS